jgi:hypothetical protein
VKIAKLNCRNEIGDKLYTDKFWKRKCQYAIIRNGKESVSKEKT